jgi:hypothetical protein
VQQSVNSNVGLTAQKGGAEGPEALVRAQFKFDRSYQLVDLTANLADGLI